MFCCQPDKKINFNAREKICYLGAVNFFKTKKNRKNWKLYTCIDNYTGQQMLKKIINNNKKFNKEVEIFMQLKK